MIRQLSATTGLTFSVAPWKVNGAPIWDATTPDGFTLSVVPESVPTRVVVSDDESGARCFDSPTTLIGHVAETITFALLAARYAAPMR